MRARVDQHVPEQAVHLPLSGWTGLCKDRAPVGAEPATGRRGELAAPPDRSRLALLGNGHRVEVGNVAEQKALGRAGFAREGVMRGECWRDGEWRDTVIYSILRTDPPA